MIIEISERIKDAQNKAKEYMDEIRDYEKIILMLRALQACNLDKDKESYTYSIEEYNQVTSKLLNLCRRHEIQIPNLEDLDWETLEIK